jgi:hypothetical protein
LPLAYFDDASDGKKSSRAEFPELAKIRNGRDVICNALELVEVFRF